MTRDHDIQLEDIPEWPLVRISLHRDPSTGAPLLTIGGTRIPVPSGHDPRRYAIQAASRRAEVLGRPIRVLASEGTDQWPLIIHPDGAITDPNAAPPRPDRARRPRQTRIPAALGIGLAGLVFLIGLAASVFAIGPTAQRTVAPPAPTSPPPASTTPTTAPPPHPRRSTPPPTSTPPTSAHPHPSPRSAPSATVPHTHSQPVPRPRPAPTTNKSTPTSPPRAEPATPPPSRAQTPNGPTIRGPVPVGDYCLAGFLGVAIAERCAPDTAEQTWTFQNGQLRQPDGCLTVADRGAILANCTGDDTQHWERTEAGKLDNIGTDTCLVPASDDRDTVTVSAVTCPA